MRVIDYAMEEVKRGFPRVPHAEVADCDEFRDSGEALFSGIQRGARDSFWKLL
jgi:hypothetical protein